MDRYDHVFEKKNLKNINGLYLILFHELLLGKESSELDSFDHVFKTRIASPPREQDLIFYDRAIAIATIFWKKSDIPKYTICLINFERCCMTFEPCRYLRFFQSSILRYWRKEIKVGKASSNSSALKSFINNFSRAVRSWSWCDAIFNLSHSLDWIYNLCGNSLQLFWETFDAQYLAIGRGRLSCNHMGHELNSWHFRLLILFSWFFMESKFLDIKLFFKFNNIVKNKLKNNFVLDVLIIKM